MRKCRQTTGKKGISTIEVALSLPLFAFLFLSTCEISSRINIKQTAATAAYEAIRQASSATGTMQDAETAASNILKIREIEEFDIQISPTGPWNRGQTITVEISVPIEGNLWVDQMYAGETITASATFVKQ